MDQIMDQIMDDAMMNQITKQFSMACFSGNDKVTKELFTRYRDLIMDYLYQELYNIIDEAARKGHTVALAQIYNLFGDGDDIPMCFGYNIARTNNLVSMKWLHSVNPEIIFDNQSTILWYSARNFNLKLLDWIDSLQIDDTLGDIYGIIARELYIVCSHDKRFNDTIMWFIQRDLHDEFNNHPEPLMFLDTYEFCIPKPNIDLVMALNHHDATSNTNAYIYLKSALENNYLDHNLSIKHIEWIIKMMEDQFNHDIILSHADPNTHGYWFRRGFCTGSDQYREYMKTCKLVNHVFNQDIAQSILIFV